jgi:hypothetical protein
MAKVRTASTVPLPTRYAARSSPEGSRETFDLELGTTEPGEPIDRIEDSGTLAGDRPDPDGHGTTVPRHGEVPQVHAIGAQSCRQDSAVAAGAAVDEPLRDPVHREGRIGLLDDEHVEIRVG